MFNCDTGNELVFIHKQSQEVLKRWFDDLQQRDQRKSFNGRVWRAELRRAKGPYESLTCAGFLALCPQLEDTMDFQPGDRLALALFAGVVAHAGRANGQSSFAAQLGKEIKGRPFLSLLRFERLQQVRRPEELYSQLMKAVKLRGDEGVNIVSLADGIFLWMREWLARKEHRPVEANPFRRNHVRWASEYLMASGDKSFNTRSSV
ncbi:type I-E CRISPR-associated protein Cse2/CasB [Serratia ureilytica]|uniref:type I-E CRISPR-associated protein Cse2/CasB n=1 Tax=Serratia ureilytica TaxID=300181 RepID=UPI001D191B43|nr:type I-E CRISPR-associated protein Cse2/CasB [Serratia ureilytica]MCC4106764.1 type I-E CRISPR-associated protein Cse2/CasB [Serratia ureilytica]